MPIVWTIAGSDPSGGAGLQADLKTFHQHGVYGCAVPTLLTVQSTRALTRVDVLDADLVSQQLAALAEDLPPAAIKTGALGNAEVVEAVAARLRSVRAALVVDPVSVASHGSVLLDEAGRRALVAQLLPLASLVTPNVAEASALSGVDVRDEASAVEAARAILELGAAAVLVKGGHLDGAPLDVLHSQTETVVLRGERVPALRAHGLGCALSAAVTARLALGEDLRAACEGAKAWVARALAAAPEVGRGLRPIDHGAPVDAGSAASKPRRSAR